MSGRRGRRYGLQNTPAFFNLIVSSLVGGSRVQTIARSVRRTTKGQQKLRIPCGAQPGVKSATHSTAGRSRVSARFLMEVLKVLPV